MQKKVSSCFLTWSWLHCFLTWNLERIVLLLQLLLLMYCRLAQLLTSMHPFTAMVTWIELKESVEGKLQSISTQHYTTRYYTYCHILFNKAALRMYAWVFLLPPIITFGFTKEVVRWQSSGSRGQQGRLFKWRLLHGCHTKTWSGNGGSSLCPTPFLFKLKLADICQLWHEVPRLILFGFLTFFESQWKAYEFCCSVNRWDVFAYYPLYTTFLWKFRCAAVMWGAPARICRIPPILEQTQTLQQQTHSARQKQSNKHKHKHQQRQLINNNP